MDATINSLIRAAYLPLSIIIIGIGNADFTQMEILDGDNGLVNQRGESCARDLVQFVPFNQFKNNPILLAQNVLYELPAQLCQYYKMVNIVPMQAQTVNLNLISGNQNTDVLTKNMAAGGFMQGIVGNLINAQQ